MKSWPMMSLRAMSESMAMQWQGSMWMSMAHIKGLCTAGPAQHWLQPLEEQALPLICHGLGAGKVPSSPHPTPTDLCSLSPAISGRAGAKVMRAGKLSLPLIGCSAWERGLWTSPRQHNGAGPGGVGVAMPAPRA